MRVLEQCHFLILAFKLSILMALGRFIMRVTVNTIFAEGRVGMIFSANQRYDTRF